MKLHIDTLLIRLLILLPVGIVMLQVLGFPETASTLFTFAFVVTFAFWLMTAGKRISRRNLLAILILILSCISVSANALMTNTEVSFSYFRKLIMFWSTILLFGAMREYRPQRSDVAFVFRWNTILACFLILLYIAETEEMYRINGIVTIYLTFRLSNPNLAAVFLSAVCMIQLILAETVEKRWKKLLHTLLAAVLVCFVLETRARNAQLFLMFFLVAWLLSALCPKGKLRIPDGIAALIAVLPFLFSMGYLLLVSVPKVQELFSFLIGEGKGLDSRVEIWTFALRSFLDSPIVGDYSGISGGTGASQMHNSHLDILASYGAPVLVLVCIFLFWVLRGQENEPGGRAHFLCRAGFGALLLSGIGEAMLFSGGMGIYLFAGMLLMLSNFDFEPREALL